MNTSGFHQNVGEGNKSLNAMSPDPFLSVAFGKGSGCARLIQQYVDEQLRRILSITAIFHRTFHYILLSSSD